MFGFLLHRNDVVFSFYDPLGAAFLFPGRSPMCGHDAFLQFRPIFNIRQVETGCRSWSRWFLFVVGLSVIAGELPPGSVFRI